MNKSESKYFNTAVRMDKAFLALLDRKDLEFISVKEICEKAGVNRSTFYLHYENIGDLLEESIQFVIDDFVANFSYEPQNFISRINDCSIDELFLITPKYLSPFLKYIKSNKKLFLTVLKNSGSFRLDKAYADMTKYVLVPILERLQVPVENRKYIVAYHIHGIMAIVTEWIKDDCSDPEEHIIDLIVACVNGKIKNQ